MKPCEVTDAGFLGYDLGPSLVPGMATYLAASKDCQSSVPLSGSFSFPVTVTAGTGIVRLDIMSQCLCSTLQTQCSPQVQNAVMGVLFILCPFF